MTRSLPRVSFAHALIALSVLGLGGCSQLGGKSNEEIVQLKTQVASLEADVTRLKQMFQQMTVLVQQQSVSIRTVEAGMTRKTVAPRAVVPAVKKKHR